MKATQLRVEELPLAPPPSPLPKKKARKGGGAVGAGPSANAAAKADDGTVTVDLLGCGGDDDPETVVFALRLTPKVNNGWVVQGMMAVCKRLGEGPLTVKAETAAGGRIVWRRQKAVPAE